MVNRKIGSLLFGGSIAASCAASVFASAEAKKALSREYSPPKFIKSFEDFSDSKLPKNVSNVLKEITKFVCQHPKSVASLGVSAALGVAARSIDGKLIASGFASAVALKEIYNKYRFQIKQKFGVDVEKEIREKVSKSFEAETKLEDSLSKARVSFTDSVTGFSWACTMEEYYRARLTLNRDLAESGFANLYDFVTSCGEVPPDELSKVGWGIGFVNIGINEDAWMPQTPYIYMELIPYNMGDDDSVIDPFVNDGAPTYLIEYVDPPVENYKYGK